MNTTAHLTQAVRMVFLSELGAVMRVARELDDVIRLRDRPDTIVSDSDTEFTSMAILRWCQQTGVARHYIAPASLLPAQGVTGMSTKF
ncbi:MAG: hypothetical protein JNK84_10770 [Phreatobacter sp.]|nr:hypothetical protein [Phreatobacter sp.]MBL8569556.1 hypothetical protein [Phreatobacter sp.]